MFRFPKFLRSVPRYNRIGGRTSSQKFVPSIAKSNAKTAEIKHLDAQTVTHLIRPFKAKNVQKHAPDIAEIQSIDFSDTHHISTEVFGEILHHTDKLETLNINRASRFSYDHLLVPLLRRTRTLKNIFMSHTHASNALLVEATKHHVALKSIDVSRCPNISNPGITALAKMGTIEAFSGNHLNLSNASFIALIENNPLKTLNVGNTHSLTQTAFTKLVDHSGQLEALNVAGQTALNADTLAQLLSKNTGIKTMDLSWNGNVNADVMKAMHDSCTRLESLDLSHNSTLMDNAVQHIGGSNLKALNLFFVNQVSDATLMQVAMASPNLETINLRGCIAVTEAGIQALRDHCPNVHIICNARLQHAAQPSP